MRKPKIICHMMASVDGKILTADWQKSGNAKQFGEIYEQVHATFKSDAWMCGRVTMEKDFASGIDPKLEKAARISQEDFVAQHNSTSFAIAVDASGRLAWSSADIDGDHIIEVLTKKASNAYMAYLRKKGISYILAGDQEIDFKLVIDKLGRLFPIKTLMLEGGGHLNGSLLNEGLIDELSLLLLPVADGSPKSPAVFEVSDYLEKKPAAVMELNKVKKMDGGIVWLHYKFNK